MRVPYRTDQLRDLIAAVFDEAAFYSADSREVSRLATQTVMHMLRRKRAKPPRAPTMATSSELST